MRIALSGRIAGKTLAEHLPSSLIFLCHLRSSAGSSVVQITFTLDCFIIP